MSEVLESAGWPADGSTSCFTVVLGASQNEERWQMAFDEAVEPRDLDTRWRLQGYDVADKFLVSGLSNCGYSADEISRPRERWGRFINAKGLLVSLEEATQFGQFADERVHSHAPFHVFGIYTLAQ